MALAWISVNSNSRDQAFAGFGGGLGGADQLDDRVDVIEGFLETFEDVGAGFRLAQFVLRAAAHDIDAVFDEVAEQLHQRSALAAGR